MLIELKIGLNDEKYYRWRDFIINESNKKGCQVSRLKAITSGIRLCTEL